MPLNSDLKGERFGRYKIVEKIGLGGMAEVYRAENSSGDSVAIKMILQSFTDNQKFVKMFLDEAKIMITLRHPNIVELYDFGKIEQVYYLAMEWIDGKPLSSLVRRQQKQNMLFPTGLAVFCAMEICSGLDYAHEKKDSFNRVLGIVHRDVSPPNILVSWAGDVKIADFGVAKAANKVSLTRPGILKGKFSYMSPEQSRGDEIDSRSDLFSLGIVLYEMLTGVRLFLRDKELDTIHAVRCDEILSPKVYNPNVPSNLEEVVMKALERNRSKRFQSAEEFGDALEKVLSESFPETNRESSVSFMQYLYQDKDLIKDKDKKMTTLSYWSNVAREDSDIIKEISSRVELSKRSALRRLKIMKLSKTQIILIALGGVLVLTFIYFRFLIPGGWEKFTDNTAIKIYKLINP